MNPTKFLSRSATAVALVLCGCGKSSPQPFTGEWISPPGSFSMVVGDGGRLRLSADGKQSITCSYTVDWTQTPPRIDLVPDLKTEKPMTGVIQLDGKDALRLCVPGLTGMSAHDFKGQFDPKMTVLFIRKSPAPGDEQRRPDDLRPPPIATIEQSQTKATAAAIRHELEMLDSAVDQWAIDWNKKQGEVPTPQDVLPYFKKGTPIHTAFSTGHPVDSLGNPLTIPPVGTPPTVSRATAEKLASGLPPDFWRPYDSK